MAPVGREALDAELGEFVAAHAHRARQRTEAWVAAKARSVGGSEVAALLGHSRYSSFLDVVEAKAGLSGFRGNAACRWGTFFEGVAERVVALDLGTSLRGTDINVPAPPGSGLEGAHANSPDGYCVVGLAPAPGEKEPAERLAAAGEPAPRAAVALLEFKCPHRRLPTGKVPRHYLPQLWSGLALSPPAQFGLFVDAAFRKCALSDLGPSPEYDGAYHRETPGARWRGAVAWGLAAVYAPTAGPGAAEGAALGRAALGPGARFPGAELVDLGEAGGELFERALQLLDEGVFRAEHPPPQLGGRPGPFPAGGGVSAALAECRPPPGHAPWGVFPWKLLELDYVPVEPRPGFLAEIRPPVLEALAAAARIRGAPDPRAAFEAYAAHRRPPRAAPRAPAGPSLQALFWEAEEGDARAPLSEPSGGEGPAGAEKKAAAVADGPPLLDAPV